jgi:hypothetical protein
MKSQDYMIAYWIDDLASRKSNGVVLVELPLDEVIRCVLEKVKETFPRDQKEETIQELNVRIEYLVKELLFFENGEAAIFILRPQSSIIRSNYPMVINGGRASTTSKYIPQEEDL